MHPLSTRLRLIKRVALSLLLAAASQTQAADTDALPQPRHLHVAEALPQAEADALLLAARRYYAFWNSGDPEYARQALSPGFVDLNLPAGRKQGPQGAIEASARFRQAVPDLTVEVVDAYVSQGTVIGRLRFSGHFSGRFGDIQGDGRAIAFDAVDIYTIRDGRILSN